MRRSLFEEFRRFEGQPVIIETTDCRRHHGIVLESYEDCVRIIDECCRLELIDFCHITSIDEPQMSLHKCKHHHNMDEHEGREEWDGHKEYDYHKEKEEKYYVRY
jgi:small nuclear ribonucleoprotein (snRNP)-like protein